MEIPPIRTYNPVLAPYDLTRGGGNYNFFGHTDVKELALYVEDQIKAKNWLFNLGIRGDLYNGLTVQRQAEPRVGIAYNVTADQYGAAHLLCANAGNTVQRKPRSLEPGMRQRRALSAPALYAGRDRNAAAGIPQRIPRRIPAGLRQDTAVVSGEYIWKYTHNAFDFSVLGNTPITFPIDWHNSKIPGFALNARRPQLPQCLRVRCHVVGRRAFLPAAGRGSRRNRRAERLPLPHRPRRAIQPDDSPSVHPPGGRFTHAMWGGFNWRYDSGLVAGAVPCYGLASADPNTPCDGFSTTLPDGHPAVDLSGLTADQEFQAGLTCNGVRATPTTPLPTPCPASEYSSSLVKIPAPSTGEQRPEPAADRSRAVFSTLRLVTTTSSAATSTRGVFGLQR